MEFRVNFLLSIILACFSGIHCFILIPEEIPSILSVFFSNLPPIKKGTDSRVAIGFRMGPNVDYQLQFEIGPQLNTQPLGPQPDNSTAATQKRHSGNAKSVIRKEMKKLEIDTNSNQNIESYRNYKQTVALGPYKISDPTKNNSDSVNLLRRLYKATAVNNSSDDPDKNNTLIE